MHKKVVCLIIVIFLFVFIQFIISCSHKKFEINYDIDTEHGKYSINIDYNKKIPNTYYINIIHNDIMYSYQFEDEYFGERIIYNLKTYKDEEKECILPLFKDKGVIFDLTCSDGNKEYYYHNMEKDGNIDAFLNNIGSYDFKQFNDDSEIEKHDMFNIYLDNINNTFSFESYRGIINIDKKVNEIKIFDNDKYTKNLGVFTENYYMIPNYDENYEFKTIYIINLNNSKKEIMKLEKPISFTSYIQGFNNDMVYLFDLENKIQYKISLEDMVIDIIGNLTRDVMIYEDKEWSKVSTSQIINEKPIFIFNDYRKKIDKNTYIDEVNNYIYTFNKNGDYYSIYKSNKYTPNIKNYLFDIEDINSIKYKDDYMYFKKDNYVAYYSEKTGIKKIIQSDELFFNQNISYNIK